MIFNLMQVAEKAGLKPGTLYGWIWRYRKGLQLSDPAKDFCERLTKIGKRCWRIDEGELSAWFRRYQGGIRGQPLDKTPSEEVTQLRELAERFREKQKPEESQAVDSLARLLEKSTQLDATKKTKVARGDAKKKVKKGGLGIAPAARARKGRLG